MAYVVAKDGEVRAHGELHDGELIHPDTQFDVHQILGSLRNTPVPRRSTGMMSDTRGARRRKCRVRPRSKCPGLAVLCYNAACPSWSRLVAKFFIGVIVGISLGASATAYGAVGSGTVPGGTVAKDGENVCSGPNTTEACGRRNGSHPWRANLSR